MTIHTYNLTLRKAEAGESTVLSQTRHITNRCLEEEEENNHNMMLGVVTHTAVIPSF